MRGNKLWIPLSVFLIAVFALGVFIRNRMISVVDIKLDPVTEAYFSALEKPFACGFADRARVYEIPEDGSYNLGVLKVFEDWNPALDLARSKILWNFFSKLPEKLEREQQAFVVRAIGGCGLFGFFQALQSLAKVDLSKVTKVEKEKIETLLKAYIDPRTSGSAATFIELLLRMSVLKICAENPKTSLRFPTGFVQELNGLNEETRAASKEISKQSGTEILTLEFAVLEKFNKKFEALVITIL